jgi:hypothetical protein
VYVSAFTGVVASTVGTTNDGWFAGGGGGAEVNGTAGAGGRGGGGRSNNDLPGTAGSPNTGGGGGGGCWDGTNANNGGAGGSGIVIVRYVLASVPAAPTGLTATASATNWIELAWTDNASNETGYVVDRSPDSNAWSQIVLTAANATNYTDTGLVTNTLYYYRVAATNAGGLSAYGYASATTWSAYEQWRQTYFTTAELTNSAVSGDSADRDNDGMLNLDEYLAGTIPTNPASRLVLYQVTPNPAATGEFLVSWQSATGRMYTVLGATNLVSNGFELILRTNIPATPMQNVYTDVVEGAVQKFYRVKLE